MSLFKDISVFCLGVLFCFHSLVGVTSHCLNKTFQLFKVQSNYNLFSCLALMKQLNFLFIKTV